MARKRMFDIEIINQDSFFDLSMEAKALYFLLGMEADDEGFVAPKKILRLYGGTVDSLKNLADRGYIIPFQSGVIVITDWKRNNYIDKNRLKETIYQDEKEQLIFNENTEKYELLNNRLTDVKQMLKENSIDKNRLDKISIDKNSIEKENAKRKIFIKPTTEEIQQYCNERNNGINANAFYDFYESKDWYIGKNKMKDWKACIRTWEKRQPKKEEKHNRFLKFVEEE